MLLFDVLNELESARVPHAIAGGYAVALHGAVRGTVDVDIVISLEEKHLVGAERALAKLGLTSRLPLEASEVYHFREEYMERRNLFAWSFVNAARPSEIVDILLTHDLRQLKTERVEAGGRRLRIVALRDLIAMKRESARPQDLADVEALERILAARRKRR